MSEFKKYGITCSKCGYKYSARLRESFNINDYLDKFDVIRDELKVICPKCLNEEDYYHSMKCYSLDGTIIQYCNTKEKRNDYIQKMERLCSHVKEFDQIYSTIRVTHFWDNFVEKVKLLKLGFDDRIIEIIKEKMYATYSDKMITNILFAYTEDNELTFNISFEKGYKKDEESSATLDYYNELKDKYFSDESKNDHFRHYLVDCNYARRMVYNIPQKHPDIDYCLKNTSIVHYITFDNNDLHGEPFISNAQISYGSLVTVVKNGEQVAGKHLCIVRELEEDFIDRVDDEDIKEVLSKPFDRKTINTLMESIIDDCHVPIIDVNMSEEEFNRIKKNQIIHTSEYHYVKKIHTDRSKNTRFYIITNHIVSDGDYEGVYYAVDNSGYYKVLETFIDDGIQSILLAHLPYGTYYLYRNDLDKSYEEAENKLIARAKKWIKQVKDEIIDMPEVTDQEFINEIENYEAFLTGVDISEVVPKITFKEE